MIDLRNLIRGVHGAEPRGVGSLLTRVSCVATDRADDAIKWAIDVSLYRLPKRLRAIIEQYDIKRESVDDTCNVLGLSRRQFYRDRRVALKRLAAFMLLPSSPQKSARILAERPESIPRRSASISAALAAGARSVGAYAEAIDLLMGEGGQDAASVLRRSLDAAEIAIEAGWVTDAGAQIDRARHSAEIVGFGSNSDLARYLLLKGHVEHSHAARQACYNRALAVAEHAARSEENSSVEVFVRIMYALSLSHDHQGEWVPARATALSANDISAKYSLQESPIGLLVRSNVAMRDARQFGNVTAGLDTLWECFDSALRNGWLPVLGEIAVHFINLNLMCLQYKRALDWHKWICRAGPARLMARTRNFLAVDSAHAFTMLGHPAQALSLLRGSDDEGLAFLGVTDYWKAEAHRVEGELSNALDLGLQALSHATAAGSYKGEARCKRLLACCYHRLGRRRTARKLMAECLVLSESFTSTYDFLLSLLTARLLDMDYAADENRLLRLLRARGSDAAFSAPADRSAQ